MLNWYKTSQTPPQPAQPSGMDPASQEWAIGMKRTFELMDFGRYKFKYRGQQVDKTDKITVMFASSSDPTLMDYRVSARLDMPMGRIDLIVMSNGAIIGRHVVQVNEQSIRQSPYEIAQALKSILSNGEQNGGQGQDNEGMGEQFRSGPQV